MTMTWTTVDDGNGNIFHALFDNEKENEAWVFFNKKESGFGNNPNSGGVTFLDGLKRMPNGHLGAGT